MPAIPSKKEIVDKIKIKISEAISDNVILQGKKIEKSIEKAAKKIARKLLKTAKTQKNTPKQADNKVAKKAKVKVIKAATI